MKKGVVNENQSEGTSRKSGSNYQQLPYTEAHDGADGGGGGGKKKKLFIGAGVGLLAIVAIVLIVVFATGKDGSDNGGDDPGPDPGPGPNPPVPDGFNPYYVDEDPSVNETTIYSQGGVLKFNSSFMEEFQKSKQSEKSSLFMQNRVEGDDPVGVDTKNVAASRGVNNDFLQEVHYSFGQASYKRTVLSLSDNIDDARFEIPDDIVAQQTGNPMYRLDMAGFSYTHDPFAFSFTSTRTGEKLIDTTGRTFIYQDKFIQVDMAIPSGNVYGFGERETSFQLTTGAWSMWPTDNDVEYDSGRGGKHLQGMHPFCLIKANQSEEFVGIFFRSSNAQSPILQEREGMHILSYITTGGNLDINFFMRGSAKDIIAEYHNFIGKPKLVPFWAMGFHASGNGWHSLDKVRDVVANYSNTSTPLESVWLNGDYMDGFKDFSLNDNFKDLKVYTKQLHDNGQKVVVTLLGGLANENNTNPYVADSNVSLIMGMDGKPFSAEVYTNETVFLDWFQQDASNTWADGLFDMYEQLVEFDGINLQLNTPTIFCEGGHPNCATDPSSGRRKLLEDYTPDTDWYQSFGSDFMKDNSTWFLPFIPQSKYNMDHQTIALNATHNATKNLTEEGEKTHKQYDTHSLFGHMQSKVTHEILSNATYNNRTNSQYDVRKLISSSSTFAGTGQYAAHSFGKMTRTWDHMRYSIASMMNFNMFGIPYAGADVCGQIESSSDQDVGEQQEICARWYQLSTFYPLARTNRDRGSSGIQIEPFDLPSTNNYDMIAKNSVFDRYKYARFVYGCLFEASIQGGTCFDPLLYHFSNLTGVYTDIEHTFMVADAVKVSPVLEALSGNDSTYQSFFPRGRWVDLDTYEVTEVTNPEGQIVNLTAAITVRKHLRPGGIIPSQYNMSDSNAQKWAGSIDELASTDINLIVNRDHHGYAFGKLFIDEGISTSELTNKDYDYYSFKVVNKTIQKFNLNEDKISEGRGNIRSIVITDAENLAESVQQPACMIDRSGIKSVDIAKPVYDNTTKTLTIKSNDDKGIDVYQMQAIILRTPDDKYSLCDVASSNWHMASDSNITQLNERYAKFDLVSDKYTEMNMTLELKLGGDEYRFVNVKIYPKLLLGDDTFKVPEEIVDVQNAYVTCGGLSCELNDYVDLNMSPTGDFLLKIHNGQEPENKTDIWQLTSFIQDTYINMIDAQVFSQNGTNFHGIAGLAERTSNELFLEDGVYSLWARDAANPVENGELPGANTYGVHPFYMTNAQDGSWFGVYTNLASAQDWYVANDQLNGQIGITMIATGGIADISVFFGDDPIEVTKAYHKIVGRPVLTPMWALGWHQSKWGYKSTQELREVIQGYSDNNLPLDTIWSDIDYMEDYKDFTYDPVNYGDLPQFVEEIHENKLQYIPIIDAGIAQRKGQNYSAYDTGVEKDVFIKAYQGGPDLTGQVWPNDAVFPNFFKDDTKEWWRANLQEFSQAVNFDGLWQDMNEASNFCNGICYGDQATPHEYHPKNHKIPFTPTGRDLQTKSMPLDAFHNNMNPDVQDVHEIDAHSLYGTMQVKESHEWFKSQNMRTMIIERSAFAGLGKFGSRWLGDNFSRYAYMGYSVTGIMMHNILGIPLAGADICGFLENTNPELCVRWYTVGAFYPFSRNHNSYGNIPQEPYSFTNDSKVLTSYTDMMRNSMQQKLAMIPYYYTEMSMISKEEGGAFYRPLFFDFPTDAQAYKNLTHNVMLGPGLKASFQSTENETVLKTEYYFPDGTWCGIFWKLDGECIEGPKNETLSSNIFEGHAHIRNGYILPLQTQVVGKDRNVTKVDELMKDPIELHINVDFNDEAKCVATGRFLSDDGLVLNITERQNIYQFDFAATKDCGVKNVGADNDTEYIYLNITKLAKAESKDEYNQTNMDFLGKIVIYDTKKGDFTMNGGNYTVTVIYDDATKPSKTLGTVAMYDEDVQETRFEPWNPSMGDQGKHDLPLFEIAALVFTAAPAA